MKKSKKLLLPLLFFLPLLCGFQIAHTSNPSDGILSLEKVNDKINLSFNYQNLVNYILNDVSIWHDENSYTSLPQTTIEDNIKTWLSDIQDPTNQQPAYIEVTAAANNTTTPLSDTEVLGKFYLYSDYYSSDSVITHSFDLASSSNVFDISITLHQSDKDNLPTNPLIPSPSGTPPYSPPDFTSGQWLSPSYNSNFEYWDPSLVQPDLEDYNVFRFPVYYDDNFAIQDIGSLDTPAILSINAPSSSGIEWLNIVWGIAALALTGALFIPLYVYIYRKY